MGLALSIFGVAFAAFCIWVTVRMIDRREAWAIRLAIILAAAAGIGWFINDWMKPQEYGCFPVLRAAEQSDE